LRAACLALVLDAMDGLFRLKTMAAQWRKGAFD
jgi:hypothetical protein